MLDVVDPLIMSTQLGTGLYTPAMNLVMERMDLENYQIALRQKSRKQM